MRPVQVTRRFVPPSRPACHILGRRQSLRPKQAASKEDNDNVLACSYDNRTRQSISPCCCCSGASILGSEFASVRLFGARIWMTLETSELLIAESGQNIIMHEFGDPQKSIRRNFALAIGHILDG